VFKMGSESINQKPAAVCMCSVIAVTIKWHGKVQSAASQAIWP
jgi:hypothetical protein